MTFKQLEAFFWVVQLGGFAHAANKLATTQSAVSKRVQELEDVVATQLFDRSQRSARLTEKGEEMFLIAKRFLRQRDEALEQFERPEVVERRLRIGMTELPAMTWLPRLVNAVQNRYPKAHFEPDVDDSFRLREKLLSERLDLIVVPDLFEDTRLLKTRIGTVQNAWMCKPGLLDGNAKLRVHDIAEQRLLTQANLSATGILYDEWFKAAGLAPVERITSNNLVAIIGMTVSGLGVSHLPKRCLRPMIRAGLLQVLHVTPNVPDVSYVAVQRADRTSTLVTDVVRMARECCAFDRPFQAASERP
ncbi:LysR family transcriptional regulator [Bordetella ansorpii]|uniref:LysR family transcriptional regulator n=1 Tax=Bordetella ansorpii TaxID=288768 RepID=A0A157SGQ7_9BORD|nr:LysR family transcriptional regulator [Bordetella ansorpii]SAI69640.1 LysR family transcriptional regulator [Bordetella ansorpii]